MSIWDNLGTPDAPEFATVLTTAADLRAARGDIAGAAGYYERAMAIRARAFGKSHPLYGESVAGMATTLLAMGDSQRALDAAIASEKIGRDHLRLMVRSLPERQALAYAAARPRGLDVLVQLAESSSDAAEPAFDSLVRSRALVLDEMASRLRGARAAGDGTPVLATYVSTPQRLAKLLVRGRGTQAATNTTPSSRPLVATSKTPSRRCLRSAASSSEGGPAPPSALQKCAKRCRKARRWSRMCAIDGVPRQAPTRVRPTAGASPP